MRTDEFLTWFATACQFLAPGAAAIWPERKWIAWTTMFLGLVIAAGTAVVYWVPNWTDVAGRIREGWVLLPLGMALGITISWLAPKIVQMRSMAESSAGNSDSRAKALRESLGAFLAEAQPLLAQASNTKLPIPEGSFSLWTDKVENYLRGYLDESYVVRFRDRTGLTLLSNPNYEPTRLHVHADIQAKMERLREFLRDLAR